MKTIEDYKTFLSHVRQETGLSAISSDDSGLVTVRVDDRYNLNLQFVEATGRILCFIEVATLPKDAPRKVYRDLLIGGLFGKETAGGYFALEDETEAVVYNYFFDFEDASKDIPEFISTMEKILQLCDIWADRIQEMLHPEKDVPALEAPADSVIHP